MTTVVNKALALIEATRSALASGCKHFDAAGNELKTEKEILACLKREGSVRVQQPTAAAVPVNKVKDCPDCGGCGHVYYDTCGRCDGSGKVPARCGR